MQKKVTTCLREFARCFWAFANYFRAFARGSCGLHREFIHVWFLAKLRELHTNIYYPLEASSLQNKYKQYVHVCRSRSTWCSATYFLKMVCESVNKDLDIHVAKGPGFTWISPSCEGPWALCEGSQALCNCLQRIRNELVTFFCKLPTVCVHILLAALQSSIYTVYTLESTPHVHLTCCLSRGCVVQHAPLARRRTGAVEWSQSPSKEWERRHIVSSNRSSMRSW